MLHTIYADLASAAAEAGMPPESVVCGTVRTTTAGPEMLPYWDTGASPVLYLNVGEMTISETLAAREVEILAIHLADAADPAHIYATQAAAYTFLNLWIRNTIKTKRYHLAAPLRLTPTLEGHARRAGLQLTARLSITRTSPS